MTTLSEDAAAPAGQGRHPAEPPRTPRLRGRLSTGHLLMLLAGAVAALANYAALTGAQDTTPVLVATDTIQAGQRLDAAALTTAEADPGEALAQRLVAATQRETVIGSVATGRIEPGEPLRPSDLADAAAPERQRAMSLPVAAAHAVGGELRPGDRVDVIATGQDRARYLVTGARVLAVPAGDALDRLDGGFSLTIAVDADTALRLAQAVHAGELDVVRSTGAAPAATGPDPGEPPSADGGAARSGSAP